MSSTELPGSTLKLVQLPTRVIAIKVHAVEGTGDTLGFSEREDIVGAFDHYAAAGEPGPTAISAFIQEHLEANGPMVRDDIRQAVIKEWLRVSDREFEANPSSKVKKALSMLVEQGLIQSLPAKGYYGPINGVDPEPLSPPETKNTVEAEDDLVEDLVEDADAEIIVGQGREYVYAFYIDVYRKVANLRGENSWPIKIGRSVDYETRMKSHTTALPDAPVLAAILRTDNSKELESALHSTLALRGKLYDGDGGGEWFLTTPDEIHAIYNTLLG